MSKPPVKPPAIIARRFGWDPGARGRPLPVHYDDRAYWARVGYDNMKGTDFRYFATVVVYVHNNEWHGAIDRKPPDLKDKPDDPLVRHLLETGATP